MRVLKYPLTRGGALTPPGRVVLVAQQHDEDTPTLWIEHTMWEPAGNQEFVVFGTGHEIPDELRGNHVGSCVCNQFVWHVYRR